MGKCPADAYPWKASSLDADTLRKYPAVCPSIDRRTGENGQPISDDVLPRKESPEDQLTCQCYAESVEAGSVDEAAAFDQGCDRGSQSGNPGRTEPWQERGDQPIDHRRPQHGTAVFV